MAGHGQAAFVKDLMTKKDKMEEDIKTWFGVLESQGNVGMHQPLVDSQGFPRNDIDIVQVRKARHQIACLQNDHKTIMKEIEAGLHKLHSKSANSSSNSTSVTQMEVTDTPISLNSQSLRHFAAINLVSRGSPAEECGLKIGDQIIEFGSVTHSNFTSLNAIAQVVQHSRNRPVRVVVLRDGSEIVLSLTPREWDGRGLLGCNLVPI